MLVDHVNIVVEDLELMLRFYTEALGLAVTKRVTIHGDWVAEVTGLESVDADVVYLEHSGGGTRVELIRYRAPRESRPPGVERPNAPGIRHIAFRVDDIAAAAAKLASAGAELLGEVKLVPDAQVTYAGGARKRIVYFRDPEANLLELCSYS